MSDLSCKLMSPKVGPFRVVKVSRSTTTIHEDCISNTVSTDRVTLAPTPTTIEDVMNDANNGKNDKLPTGAMQQAAHLNHVMDNIINAKSRDSDERNVDINNDKLAEQLHEPAQATQEYAMTALYALLPNSKTSDKSYAGMAIHLLTIRSAHPNTSANTLLLAIGND